MSQSLPRRRPRRRSWPVLLSLVALASPAASQQPQDYLSYDALTGTLRRLADQHRDLVKLQSIGKTREGRDIWLVELGGRGSAPKGERPALFVAANLEGEQLVGSALALAMIDRLATAYATDSAVKARLDSTTFYVVPRANPDAAEGMFAAVKTGRRTNATPFDDDNDARIDEDGPEDLNGDGQITMMRVRDPRGDYMIDPADTRLLKRADPKKGEHGTYKLYWEGIDNDGDSLLNEDAPGGVDLNRNFQQAYPYYTRDAGRHMVSEPESRALMDFLIAHRNVAAMVVFGASDNLIVPGDTASERHVDLHRFASASADVLGTDTTFGRDSGASERPMAVDQPYFAAVSAKYRALTGLKEPAAVRRPRGALYQFGYHQYGVPSFSTPGWGLVPPAGGDPAAGAIDRRLVQWLDSAKIDGFVPWTPFKHPTLGDVEIGGFKPYAISNPPASALATLGPAHTQFALYLASLLPRITIASLEAKSQGGGLVRVSAEIANTGFFPTAMAHGVKPTMVQLGVPPETIVAGAAKTSFIQLLEGSGRRASFEWLIRGKSGERVTLTVRSEKAGVVTQTFTLP